jgi:glycosyltransferase involved in cell wall biosynthesis
VSTPKLARSAGRRVAFVTPLHFGSDSYVGGGERYPLNLARGLLATDPYVHVDVIGVGAASRVMSLQPRLDVHVLPLTLPGVDPLDHLSSSLGNALESADLVHIHQAFTRSSQVAILIAKLLGAPIALTDHGATTNQVARAVDYLSLVDLFVLQSQFAAGQLGVDGPQVTIPGGVDDRFFRPPPTPVTREFVLFAGRVLPHKGVDRLISALPRDLPCVVVGRHYNKQYARYVRALASSRDVTFIEDADDLALRDYYRRAWVTVLPSVHRDAWGNVYHAPELMGFTPLESMACGTPVIVSSAAALPEFVRDGETGYIIDGLAELTHRVQAFSSGDDDPDEFGRRARTLVEREYSVEAVGTAIWSAYQRLWFGGSLCAS